jgi:hypothetical protein
MPLMKYHDQRKSQWIRCNINHDFPVLDRMPRPFRQCFSTTEHNNKFVVDGLDRESLHREKQTDWLVIHWTVHEGWTSFSICSSQISIFLYPQISWNKTFKW